MTEIGLTRVIAQDHKTYPPPTHTYTRKQHASHTLPHPLAIRTSLAFRLSFSPRTRIQAPSHHPAMAPPVPETTPNSCQPCMHPPGLTLTRNPARDRNTNHNRRNWVRAGGCWMSTKIGSQQKRSPEDKYRREDQYLCIEIQDMNHVDFFLAHGRIPFFANTP